MSEKRRGRPPKPELNFKQAALVMASNLRAVKLQASKVDKRSSLSKDLQGGIQTLERNLKDLAKAHNKEVGGKIDLFADQKTPALVE